MDGWKKAMVLQEFNKDEYPINIDENIYSIDEDTGRSYFWHKKDNINYKFVDMGFEDKWMCTMAINMKVLGK